MQIIKQVKIYFQYLTKSKRQSIKIGQNTQFDIVWFRYGLITFFSTVPGYFTWVNNFNLFIMFCTD